MATTESGLSWPDAVEGQAQEATISNVRSAGVFKVLGVDGV